MDFISKVKSTTYLSVISLRWGSLQETRRVVIIWTNQWRMKNGSSVREVSQKEYCHPLLTFSKLPLGQKKKDLRSTTLHST